MRNTLATWTILLAVLSAGGCGKTEEQPPAAEVVSRDWRIAALPSSVRLDPVRGRVIEDRTDLYQLRPLGDLLERNWVYDGRTVRLAAARGEYVSFQLAIEVTGSDPLDDIQVRMEPFRGPAGELATAPEPFLEWAVEVKEKSFGYERSSYGPGWYPDALIPLACLETDPAREGRLWYPLRLPDFRNRIPGQRWQLIWVDQFLPSAREAAPPGEYRATVTVRAGGEEKSLPVVLEVWDFALPNANSLAGNLQHEGFLRRLDPRLELELYQLFKRNRVVPVDPTYTPGIALEDGQVRLDWQAFDQRLGKYFSGEAFTDKYGYRDGPGYGEPLELYVLPFDCPSDRHGGTRPGWPDVGTQAEERRPENQARYVEAIRRVREHMLALADPAKTRLVVFQGGLDESYDSVAWERMAFYGKLFKQHFPEAKYRVDGGYSPEAMAVIHEAIDYWCCHTIGYNFETVEQYRQLGVTDWIYGPVLYERKENSGVGSSTFIDLEPLGDRVISWACWKYRALTWCSWGIGSQWQSAWYNPETWKLATRRAGEPVRGRAFNGNALLVYSPGIVPNVDVPCPSLRLKSLRDGVEEYEYFRLLTELDGGPERVDRVVERIVERPFGEQSVGRFEVWNHNPEDWDQARLEIGRMIAEKAAAAN